jgi:hypothetical protein
MTKNTRINMPYCDRRAITDRNVQGRLFVKYNTYMTMTRVIKITEKRCGDN